MSASAAVASQQARKPYTITKQRERWTEEEHSKFLEALKLYGRAWRRIEEYIGTKTAVQIRSHAQKFFTKLEREQASGVVSIGHDIEVPPPRPKRKPSHPYPKKAGLSSSNSISDRDAEFLPLQLSPSCECSSKLESTQPARSLSSLKLFGVVLDPPERPSPPPTTEEESAGESGVTSRGANSNSTTSLRVHHSEVSSRDHEAPGAGQDPQKLLDAAAMAAQPLLAAAAGMDQVALSNLIALHYASFMASFHAASSGGADYCRSPWQLLDPQKHQDASTRADIIRWHSVTDSSSPSSVTRVIGRKRPSPEESGAEENKRRREEDDKCCSSSVTASSVDKEGDEEAGSLATTLRLDREDDDPRVGGFVRYKRPGQ